MWTRFVIQAKKIKNKKAFVNTAIDLVEKLSRVGKLWGLRLQR